MKMLIHFRGHGSSYFHFNPQHALFSLVASFVLAVLVLLVLISSAE